MKIAVCVKEVPDASAPKRLDPQSFRLDRSVAGALNEFDTHAIEEGLQLRDRGGEGEVVDVRHVAHDRERGYGRHARGVRRPCEDPKR